MKLPIDRFTLLLVAAVGVATVLPVSGEAAIVLNWVARLGVALLFFLHGARLPREAILAGLLHWRLHLFVLCCTFVLFPVLGLLLEPLIARWLAPALVVGILYLCALPSTVQSSIAFTAIARGNIPAAVCSASASNLLGVFLTPLLLGLLLSTQGQTGNPGSAIGGIVLQLLLPFIAGHLLRPVIGAIVDRCKPVLTYTDRGIILLVIYAAFSQAVIEDVWHQVSPWMLGLLSLICLTLFGTALTLIAFTARRLRFGREDEIAIVFCGSKKSLVAGVPMANILFAGNPELGLILLPIMLFHPLQLMICAVVAQHYGKRAAPAATQAG